jgi:D-threo-aldose 1-dehydrogenase
MGIGLKDVPSPVTISTKVGRVLRPLDSVDAVGERHGFVDAQPFEPVFDYSYDGILRSFDESLARLGRERIEIIYVHDLGRITHGDAHDDRFRQFFEGGYRALERLKSEGRIEAIGIGANEWQVCEDALAQADFDGFLLAGRYTLLEQSALDSFLPLCAARGCSVVLGGPFNSGILARGIGDREPTTFNYQPAPPEVLAKVERIQRVCEAHGVPLKAAALQFGGHHPQVVSTIPGLGDVRQVQEAVEFTSLPIPKSLWSDLKNEGLLREDAPTDEGVWL